MPPKGGFRALTYDAAFDTAVERENAISMAKIARNAAEREFWRNQIRVRGNQITPAWRQASAPFASMVRAEAAAWIEVHGGMPNVAEFIKHFQSLACATRLRWMSGRLEHASDDAVRKILVRGGIHNPRARPKRGD